jgi:hypothetical protein
MQRLCRSCSEWHSLDEPWPQACASHFAVRSDGGTMKRPMVISDTMDAVRSMADGKMYESKSRMSAEQKARGYIEVGNDTSALMKQAAQKPERPRIKKDDIRQAIAKVRNGYRPNLPAD